MSTKKSMFFLFAVILISLAFMTSLFFGGTSPTILNGSDENDSLDSVMNELITDDMKKDLKVVVSMDTEEYLKLVELSLQFEEDHKDLKIELENISKEEAYDEYKRASQIGDAPDIMLLNNVWINEFAALSYLAEVDEILTSNIQDLQIAPMISQVKWNGFLWAIPKEVDPYILAWNKNRLLEQELSQPPSSIEELIVMNHLPQSLDEPSLDDPGQAEEEKEYGFYIDFDDPFAFISLMWTLGVTFKEPQEDRTVNSEETIQKLERFFYPPQNLEDEDEPEQLLSLSSNYPRVDEEFDPWTLLNDGEMLMMITTLSDFNNYASSDVDLVALPILNDIKNSKELKGGWLNGKSFAVSSKSSIKKEAFEWIQSVTTTEAQLELMDAGGGLPVMISAYSERLGTIPYFQEIVDAIEQGDIFPAQPEFSTKMKIVQTAMNDLWLDDLTISEFVEEIETSWDALMDP